MTFEARYAGRCPACSQPIEPGDRVAYDDDVLVHDSCVGTVPVERPVTVCGACFLTKPCGCDDE